MKLVSIAEEHAYRNAMVRDVSTIETAKVDSVVLVTHVLVSNHWISIVLYVSIVHVLEAPSCNDGKQNGNETGVDCGGPCLFKCNRELCSLDKQCKSLICRYGSCAGNIDRCLALNIKSLYNYRTQLFR